MITCHFRVNTVSYKVLKAVILMCVSIYVSMYKNVHWKCYLGND